MPYTAGQVVIIDVEGYKAWYTAHTPYSWVLPDSWDGRATVRKDCAEGRVSVNISDTKTGRFVVAFVPERFVSHAQS